jgi:hypothetical protein
LERAKIVPGEDIQKDIVDLGSWVTFRDHDSERLQPPRCWQCGARVPRASPICLICRTPRR